MTGNNPAGFPRPVLPYKGKNTPVPWIGGPLPEMGKWAGIEGGRNLSATNLQLCIICGEQRGNDWVYALFNGKAYNRGRTLSDSMLGIGGSDVGPAPTFGHPRCILLAATFCPHLKAQEYPAKTQGGRLLTYEELRRLAHPEVPA